MPHRRTLGCKSTDVPLHVFPNPNKFPDCFKTWVNLVGGKLETPSDYEFYKKQRLCDIHFSIDQKNRFKHLNALAVPSHHLPGTSRFQQLVVTSDGQPTTFQPIPVGLEVSGSLPMETTDDDQSTATQPTATQPSTDVLGEINSVAICHVLAEHNYFAISEDKSKRVTNVASGISFHTRSNIVRPFQKKIKYLQTEISVLRKRGQLYKERLSNAQKLSQNVIFKQVIQHMTTRTTGIHCLSAEISRAQKKKKNI